MHQTAGTRVNGLTFFWLVLTIHDHTCCCENNFLPISTDLNHNKCVTNHLTVRLERIQALEKELVSLKRTHEQVQFLLLDLRFSTMNLGNRHSKSSEQSKGKEPSLQGVKKPVKVRQGKQYRLHQQKPHNPRQHQVMK